MKNVRNNFLVKCILLIAIVAVGIISVYSIVVDRQYDEANENVYPSNAYEILASKDLDKVYPATPSEVLKLYNKYLKYMYNNEVKEEEQFKTLVLKVRQMWSKEWLALNEENSHVESFKDEVTKFMEAGNVMSNYTVSDSATIKDFVTPDGVEGKALQCSYLYKKKKDTVKMYMMFYLLNDH